MTNVFCFAAGCIVTGAFAYLKNAQFLKIANDIKAKLDAKL